MKHALKALLICAASLGMAGQLTARPANEIRLPKSIGSPIEGRLAGGVELEPSSSLKLKRAKGPRWALPQLLDLLHRGAKKVNRRHAGSVLLVGDLSAYGGGPLARHLSHQSGRDADVGFYFVDSAGKPVHASKFLAVHADGSVEGKPGWKFDDARNWLLVQAWITAPRVRTQHIFVSEPLRQRLLSFARENRVYRPVLHRASLVLKQPSRGSPHDDHFHVRIACPRKPRGVCVSEPLATVN